MERYKKIFKEKEHIPNNIVDFYNSLSKHEKSLIQTPYPHFNTNLDKKSFMNIYDIHYTEILKKFFHTFKYPLKIYRSLNILDNKEINYENIGKYWTHDLKFARSYWFRDRGNTFLLLAIVNIQDIDWNKTIILNLLTPENEIRLLPDKKIKIIGIKKIEDNKFKNFNKIAIT